MELLVINTGSQGNCYAIVVNGKYLLLDCGVPYLQIARALEFNMSNVVGVLLSHEHEDHSRSVHEFNRRGIRVYTSQGTADALHGMFHVMGKFEQFMVGEFTIVGFDVPHDAKEPFGFLISHPQYGTLCFITDAMYCKYKFEDLRYLIIEANYSKELLKNDPVYLQRRISTTHMSIETCCEFVENNKQNLESIVLIHLSDRNSDEEEYKTRLQKQTGKRIYVAEKGQRITL